MAAHNTEPGRLEELMIRFGKAFPEDGNIITQRFIYECVHQVATEVPDVTYESTVVAGRPCLWIRPASASTKHVILFMHGGGYTIGSPTGHRKLAAHLAKACNCISLSVDYRMTPEHKYPAAMDDCLSAYKYLLDQGIKPEHIVTAGDSCGGGLATIIPLAARRDGLPLPGAAVGLSPWTDLTNSSESVTSNKGKDVLNSPEFLAMITERYIGGTGADAKDPLISPVYGDLKGLPPHWISVAGWDLLRDDGIRLAEKAKEADVEVVLDMGEKQQHVYEFMAGTAPEADDSLRRIGDWVRQKIGS